MRLGDAFRQDKIHADTGSRCPLYRANYFTLTPIILALQENNRNTTK